ncbi:S8/S53 family peptidase [Flavobacterium sp. MAH-1]|uniref:S8/S53 family peptidase n=1 Tax=Flavobacterium agri TaxID=2743471 RepID=A0A7Y8Y5I9_9FLAO|nr:S8/S53 family peptidase [Flavobacterium agri]NUY82289.1 S8/S53 family peptidase [Flavobacterium agri]NYA72313.1 S8/S53 family peptidase [Flavobacterium agri]
MYRNYLKILAIFSLLVLASCSNDETDNRSTDSRESRQALTTSQINAQIEKSLKSNGDFLWKSANDHFVWSALYHSDFIVSVGFGDSHNDLERSKSPKNATIQSDLLDLISHLEQADRKDFLIVSDPILNTMDVIIKKETTIAALRKAKYIRYVEPANYRFSQYQSVANRPKDLSTTSSGVDSGSGCGYDAVALATADYTSITPNAKVAWTLTQHNVPQAWTLSTGSGITIGIVDTGTSPSQTLLGSNFNDGLSSGRSIQKNGVYVDSVWPWVTTTDGVNDLCGHGTSMASAAAAPRNDNGLPVGVAYNSNLVTYRAAANVVLEGYQEQEGVKKAFTALGNNANVKIISMSMGHLFSVGKISDAIKFAYGKGKLIFCAAGTSTSATTFVGVIFPATMAETVAVTGVKEGSYVKCDDCHSGSKVEFTIAMQRSVSGNKVPVVSYYDNQTDYVGGSSVATATTAGMAALVWSRYPSWTRDQVLSRMRQSSYFFPNKNSQFGYGNINALLAVQ